MDLLLRNAEVVDGTGAPGRRADVAVAGDEIVAVGAPGSLDAAAGDATIVDLEGLVLAPGFIDIHTHYDAQVLWDPDFTPSSWHGITSVVMGNCGFGVAPTRPDHRETILRTLENVEGMSYDALAAGVSWGFETFPEYLDLLDRVPKRLNVGALIGHTPLRLYVVGDEERPAKSEEIERMAALVDEAMRVGAMGFATSKALTHQGAGGRPVPSRNAELEEVLALVRTLRAHGRGVIQVTPGPGMGLPEFEAMADASGRPVSMLAALTSAPGRVFKTLDDWTARPDLYPQVSCRPLIVQAQLSDPFPWSGNPAVKEVLAESHEHRAALYADPEWRARAREGGAWGLGDFRRTRVQESETHPELIDGPTIAELAEQQGVHGIDVLCEIALSEGLRTRFRIVVANDNEEEVAQILAGDRGLLGLSDAGAHASQLCDAVFSTELLGKWVRDKEALTLEHVVWRMTGHPASAFGVTDRGTVEVGKRADLVAFDPARVGTEKLRRVHDLPAGADRLIAGSFGIEHVWVNGVQTRQAGRDLEGARPGRVLRGGAAAAFAG